MISTKQIFIQLLIRLKIALFSNYNILKHFKCIANKNLGIVIYIYIYTEREREREK